MTTFLTSLLLAAALAQSSVGAAPAQAQGRFCLSPMETRESVAIHRLRDPMALLRDAALQTRAEPLGSRLCRWDDIFVYEMTLLRRDGRVVRVFADAISGSHVGPRQRQER